MSEIKELSKQQMLYVIAAVKARKRYDDYGDEGELTQDYWDHADLRWDALREDEKEEICILKADMSMSEILAKYKKS